MADDKFNVLIIHSDQQRADTLACFGNDDIKTDALDNLAKDGVRYTQNFSTYPVCTPSRYSLLSGFYVHQHLGWTNTSTFPSGLFSLPKKLKSMGYKTTAVGKMHFTPIYLDMGFDDMCLAEQAGNGRYMDDYHEYLMKNGLVDKMDMMDQVGVCRKNAPQEYYDKFGAFKSDLDYEHHSTTWIARNAIERLDKWDKDDNNMMMIGFIKPHHPFDPPAPYDTMYSDKDLKPLAGYCDKIPDFDLKTKGFFKTEVNMTDRDYQRVLGKYYGTITHIDDEIAKIISKLKEKGLYDNTMIIFTSDHGDYMGQHRMIIKAKSMYDSLLHVPLIIKYPKNYKAGEINDSITSVIDIVPTVLDGLNITNDELPGISLLQERDIDFCVASDHRRSFMIKDKKYKLITDPDNERCFFFDMVSDPNEFNNLFNDESQADSIKEYKTKLANYLMEVAVPPLNEDEYARAYKPELDYEALKDKCSGMKEYLIDAYNKKDFL